MRLPMDLWGFVASDDAVDADRCLPGAVTVSPGITAADVPAPPIGVELPDAPLFAAAPVAAPPPIATASLDPTPEAVPAPDAAVAPLFAPELEAVPPPTAPVVLD